MDAIWLMLLIPLAASTLIAFLPPGRFLPGALAVAGTGIAFILSCIAAPGNAELPWLQSGVLNLPLLFSFHDLRLIQLITGISLLVQFYSLFYLSPSANHRSYFSLLGFFTFAMLGLATTTHLLATFFFWELVGYCSYRLIGFDGTKTSASAALKALLINKVGDVCFLTGILLLVSMGITSTASLTPTAVGTAPLLLIFAGVAAKSAQAPLFPWLTAAMAGPTPVSALLHSATMVAAGVLVLLRLTPLLNESVSVVVAVTGGLTVLLGGLLAIFSYDIKRILAYSTISQLGLLVLAIGVGAASSAYLHLQTHAVFKAGLFLCAGAFIHHAAASGIADPQDIRSLAQDNGWLKWSWLVLIASLVGLPFTAGFLSKEALLHDVMRLNNLFSIFVWISIPLTAVYAGRLSFFLVAKRSRSFSRQFILLPGAVLGLVSIVWFLTGIQSHRPEEWLPVVISQVLIIAGLFIGVGIARSVNIPNQRWHQNFGLDVVYDDAVPWLSATLGRLGTAIDRIVIDRLLHGWAYLTVLAAHLIAWIDRAIVDLVLVGGSAWVIRFTGQLIRVPMSGNVQGYLLWALFSLFLFLVLWLLL